MILNLFIERVLKRSSDLLKRISVRVIFWVEEKLVKKTIINYYQFSLRE
jgi:hypothetical protein